MRKLFHLLYKLHLKKPYHTIDRLRYLKRLKRQKHAADDWYYSDKDAWQYRGQEILISSRFRDIPVMFFCDPCAHVEKKIIRDGLYDVHILNYMVQFVSPDTIVLDIGANIGAYAIPLAKTFPHVKVHAFEPNPYALGRLKRNIAINGIDNVTVYQAAAGAAPATRVLYAFDSGDAGLSSFIEPKQKGKKYETVPVEILVVDNVFRGVPERISAIKVDVQGYEVEVLEGSRNVITTHRPCILFEHEDSNFEDPDSARKVKERLRGFFLEMRYDVFYITRYDPYMLFPVDWERPLYGNLMAIPQGV
jgi:FkbM family methyltransferase